MGTMFSRRSVAFFAFILLGRSQSIDNFFKETFDEMLRNNPEFATSVGHHEYDDRWTDWSKAGREHRRAFLQERLAALSKFPRQAISGENGITADLVRYDFQSRLDAWDLETHLLRVGQLSGFHNRVYLLVDVMPAYTVRDYENIVARLKAVPAYVDQGIRIMDEAIASGMMQPRIVADRVVAQLAAQSSQDANTTALLERFRKFPSNIPKPDQDRLRAAAEDAYNRSFLPAWRKLHDYMVSTYTPHARRTDSLSSIPDGVRAYAVLVRRLTTTDATAEQIHKTGEQEVARLEGEMTAIARKTGFNGSLAEFQQHLLASPEQHFKSKDEMLVYCRNIAKIIEPQLPNEFRRLPVLLYGVRPIPEEREASTATNAQAPSPDFTTPGWFNLNTYEPEKQVKYDKEALVLHEAVPGHIFQITLAESQKNLPELRRFYGNSAFVEGWALYVESLGSELGVYRDTYSRYGQLASERFRAVRLVVDTGIHHLGWTRDQAIEYFRAHAPEAKVAEIDRYISWPGQALAYKMGQLEIRSLRSKAEQSLGPRFDVREFHDAVLQEGALPLQLLAATMDRFIAGGSR
jgi:uncharacterized protein (DUF885 family)